MTQLCTTPQHESRAKWPVNGLSVHTSTGKKSFLLWRPGASSPRGCCNCMHHRRAVVLSSPDHQVMEQCSTAQKMPRDCISSSWIHYPLDRQCALARGAKSGRKPPAQVANTRRCWRYQWPPPATPPARHCVVGWRQGPWRHRRPWWHLVVSNHGGPHQSCGLRCFHFGPSRWCAPLCGAATQITPWHITRLPYPPGGPTLRPFVAIMKE